MYAQVETYPGSQAYQLLQLSHGTGQQITSGDYVRLQTGQEGFVEDIDGRSISIREPPNNLVIVPNMLIAQAIFTNYRLPEPRVATRVPLRVTYGSDLDFVEQLAPQAARRALDDIGAASSANDAYLRVEEFAETTVNVSVNYFAPRVVNIDSRSGKAGSLRLGTCRLGLGASDKMWQKDFRAITWRGHSRAKCRIRYCDEPAGRRRALPERSSRGRPVRSHLNRSASMRRETVHSRDASLGRARAGFLG